MYKLMSGVPTRQLLLRHAPTLIAALAIAEMFFKWKSFLLEAGGFLVTWYLLDAAVSFIEKARGKGEPVPPPR